MVEREIAPGAAQATAPVSLVTTPTGERIDYIANIHARRFGLDGSYFIYIFMGQPSSEDPADWAFDTALVGSHGIFATAGMTKNQVSVSGAVPLTRSLTAQVAAGALADMTQASVVPFLQTQLQWRIATVCRLPPLVETRLTNNRPTSPPSPRARSQACRSRSSRQTPPSRLPRTSSRRWASSRRCTVSRMGGPGG